MLWWHHTLARPRSATRKAVAASAPFDVDGQRSTRATRPDWEQRTDAKRPSIANPIEARSLDIRRLCCTAISRPDASFCGFPRRANDDRDLCTEPAKRAVAAQKLTRPLQGFVRPETSFPSAPPLPFGCQSALSGVSARQQQRSLLHGAQQFFKKS